MDTAGDYDPNLLGNKLNRIVGCSLELSRWLRLHIDVGCTKRPDAVVVSVGLDVKHRCPVKILQSLHREKSPINLHQFNQTQTNRIRPARRT